jgi:WD40 repeat protein
LVLQQKEKLTIINTQTGVMAKRSFKTDLRIDEMGATADGKLLFYKGFSNEKSEHFFGLYSLAEHAFVITPVTKAGIFNDYLFCSYHNNLYAFDMNSRKWIPYPDATVGARLTPSAVQSLPGDDVYLTIEAKMVGMQRTPSGVVAVPKGEAFISMNSRRPVSIWEPKAGRVRKLDGIPSQLRLLDVIDSEAMLFTDDKGEFVVWDYKRNAEAGRVRCRPSLIVRPSVALSPDEKWLAIATGGNGYLFSLATGQLVRPLGHEVNLVAFTRNSRFLIEAVWRGNELVVQDLSKQEPVRILRCEDDVSSIAATDHPTRILVTEQKVGEVIDMVTGEKCYQVTGSAAAVSVDGTRICAAQSNAIVVFDSKDGRELQRCPTALERVSSLAIDRDRSTLLVYGESKTLATTLVIFKLVVDHRLDAIDLVSGRSRVLRDFPATRTSYHLLFPGEGRRFVAWAEAPGLLSNSTGEGTTIELRDSADGKVISTLAMRGSATVTSAALSRDGKLLFVIDSDGVLSLWRIHDQKELARLLVGSDEHWVITDPKSGRFDSDNLESIPQFRWVAPDEPFQTLPPEIFLRDYYQPNLLVSILRGDTPPPLPKLTSRNRLRPDVSIESVTSGANSSSAVVKVRVTRTETSAGIKSDVVDRNKIAAFDLRLYRNGQLVEQYPMTEAEPVSLPEPDPNSSEQLAAWREANRIELKSAGSAALTFEVPLPSRSKPGPVEFTAYCFNEDRVKSETAHFSYRTAEYTAPHKPRAYVLCVGASDYGNPAFDLTYAADDASSTAKALSADGRLARYQVVPVVLVTDKANRLGTKETLKAALELMAGPTDRGDSGWQHKAKVLRDRVPGGRDLSPATPDDLVLVSFSGHGYTDERNEFYLVMPEVGPMLRKGQRPSTEALKGCVSEDELAGWLRRVDAGEMALVVDACHSAATVEQSWFKPGPMGSRGLGQLAYDKRMRVLAASQADDFALESASLRHGLLTYALVADGLDGQKADFQPKDGRVTLGEWLAYGVERVPDLHKRLQERRPLDDPASRGDSRNFLLAWIIGRGSFRDDPAPGGDPTKGSVKLVLVDRKGEAPKVVDATAELVRLSSMAKDRAFQTPALFDYARGRQDPTLAKQPTR